MSPPPGILALLARSRWGSALIAGSRLLIIGLVLGAVYTWAGPRLYPTDTRFGFAWGMAHGACMPMAFPALLLGQEVSIYATTNTGRTYKLGYIAGINLCGLLFFGGAFWTPHSRAVRTTTDGRSQ